MNSSVSDWCVYDTRLKYCSSLNDDGCKTEMYICLDNKFYGWGTRPATETDWMMHTVGKDEGPQWIRFAPDWFDRVLEGMAE